MIVGWTMVISNFQFKPKSGENDRKIFTQVISFNIFSKEYFVGDTELYTLTNMITMILFIIGELIQIILNYIHKYTHVLNSLADLNQICFLFIQFSQLI